MRTKLEAARRSRDEHACSSRRGAWTRGRGNDRKGASTPFRARALRISVLPCRPRRSSTATSEHVGQGARAPRATPVTKLGTRYAGTVPCTGRNERCLSMLNNPTDTLAATRLSEIPVTRPSPFRTLAVVPPMDAVKKLRVSRSRESRRVVMTALTGVLPEARGERAAALGCTGWEMRASTSQPSPSVTMRPTVRGWA